MKKPRGRDLGIPFEGKTGTFNALTDVSGVTVGYATVIEGDSARTGVTIIHPRGQGDHTPVYAGVHSFNGNGEMTGAAWVFIPLLGLSGLFAFERQQGTLRRLLATPTSKATFLLGAISGQVLAAIVQMTLLVTFGSFVLNLNWGREPLALAVLMVSFALAASALGTTLGTFVKTDGQASGLSIMLGMVMALMGGCWYPLELFPETVQNIVKVLPTTWAMQGLLDLVLRGGGLMDILPEAGVLLGFAGVFFAVGVMRFRYE